MIKELTSRLLSSRELRPIFGNLNLINSQREPLSLGAMLQHSRFDESDTGNEGEVTNVVLKVVDAVKISLRSVPSFSKTLVLILKLRQK